MKNATDWDEQLPYVMAAYRATEHKSTSCTPNLLMLNRETTCPLDLMVGHPPGQEPPECPVEYVEWVRQTMHGAYCTVYDNLGRAATRQSQDYNRNVKHRRFEVGDWVWRWYPPDANKKLKLGWVGPYLVMGVLTPWVYKIQRGAETTPVNVHVDHLKPFEGEPPGDWTEKDSGDVTLVEESGQDDSGDVTLVEDPGNGDSLHGDVVEEQPGAQESNPGTEPAASAPSVVPFIPRSRRARQIRPREIYSPS